MGGMNDALASWYKRAENKGPYFLYEKRPFVNYRNIPGWHQYYLIWTEKNKTKLAIANDGLSVRYGFDTLAVLTGKTVTGLWQASANLIDEHQLQAMLNVANGAHNLPTFDIRSLKDVEW